MNQNKIISEQNDLYETLVNEDIVELAGFKYPLDWNDEEVPIYSNPDIPFVQLSDLYLSLKNGEKYCLRTYQVEHAWGILMTKVEDIPRNNNTAISFDGSLKKRIKKIDYSIDDVKIDSVKFVVGDRTFIIAAGEVEPCRDGVIYRKNDESILFFENEDSFSEIKWNKKLNIKLY